MLQKNILIREWMVNQIRESRAKDYENPFRKMIYETDDEMNKIVGRINDNSFIKHEMDSLTAYKKTIGSIFKKTSSNKTKKAKVSASATV